jgi:hypothetical protein
MSGYRAILLRDSVVPRSANCNGRPWQVVELTASPTDSPKGKWDQTTAASP